MRSLLSALFLTLAAAPLPASAEESAPTRMAPKPGSPILIAGKPAPKFRANAWLQGEPVAAFQKDKTYLLEFWASWSDSSIKAIPHLNELNHQFKDKGLVVIGVNVWDGPEEKVRKFVKENGMAYRIACGGTLANGFSQPWLQTVRTTGMPCAFVVRNGTILWRGQPDDLTGDVVTSMILGKFKPGDLVKQQVAGVFGHHNAGSELLWRMRNLIQDQKIDEAEMLIDYLKELKSPTDMLFCDINADIAIARGKPEQAVAALKQAFSPLSVSPDSTDIVAYWVADSMLSKPELGVARDYNLVLDCVRRAAAAKTPPSMLANLGLFKARALYGLNRKDESVNVLEAVDVSQFAPLVAEDFAHILRELKAGKPWPKGRLNPDGD